MRPLTEQTFLELLNNVAGQKYLELIQKVRSENRGIKKEPGFEIHHVHPRGLGGDKDAKENLIKLTTLEHCLCHGYLAQSIPCGETLAPITKLSGRQVKSLSDLERVTLEDYVKWSELREKALKVGWTKGRKMPHSEETKRKIREARKGYKHSQETIEKLRESHKGNQSHLGISVSSSTKQKISDTVKTAYASKAFVWKAGRRKTIQKSELEDILKTGEYFKTRAESLQHGEVDTTLTYVPHMYVYREGKALRVYTSEEVEEYLKQGYFRSKNESLAAVGMPLHTYDAAGKVYLYSPTGERHRFTVSEAEQKEREGWFRSREECLHHLESTGQEIPERMQKRMLVFMEDGSRCKVDPKLGLDWYLSRGYFRTKKEVLARRQNTD